MTRLDQVVLTWTHGERVTLTVEVARPGVRPGGPERRLAEQIAAAIWLAWQAAEFTTAPPA